jgi:MFS family permease
MGVSDSLKTVQASSPETRRRAFQLLYVCLTLTGIGNSMLFAILPPLTRELGVSEVWVGMIYTTSALLFLCMSPIWGALSDRIGRRPLIVWGLGWFSVSALVFALGALAGQMGWMPPVIAMVAMALSRCLFGGFGSATNPSAQAYVADRTTPQERTQSLAAMTSSFAVGSVLGPALAAAFAQKIGIAAFMMVIAGLVGASAILVWLILPEKTRPKKQGRPVNPLEQFKFAYDKRLRVFVAFAGIVWLSNATSLQTIGFYTMDRLALDAASGLQLAGIALTAGALALILAQLVVIPAFKPSPRNLMIYGGVSILLGNILLVVSTSYGAIVCGYMGSAFGFGLSRSGFTAGASLAVEPEEQGRAAGLTIATAGLGFLIAPVTGLTLYQFVGASSPFLLNGVLALGAIVMAVIYAPTALRQLMD